MSNTSRLVGRNVGAAVLLGSILALPVPVRATESGSTPTLKDKQLWELSLRRVSEGDFSGAADAVNRIQTDSGLTTRLRTWLQEFQTEQERRRALNVADLELYKKYAKQRIERGEYNEALSWIHRAADVAENREQFLKDEWITGTVRNALEKANEYRKENKWKEAWYIYNYLAALFDHEPGYSRLEEEAVNHLRLEAMFEDGSRWKERIERVQWRDAETALDYVEAYYVEPPDFRQICEGGLRQLLLLADSKKAQEVFEKLGNEHDRADFKTRVQEHLDQVSASAFVSRRETVRRFRRVVKKINQQTVQLPEELIVSELMRGAFESLDDFTTMIWPRATEEFEKRTRGDFIGVGISIIKNKLDQVEVVTPLEDTPAYHAGVQAGDIITHADGKSLKELSLNKVVETITGPENTKVTLTIQRGDDTLEFPLIRKKVKIQSVKGWKRDEYEAWDHWLSKEEGIAYVRLTNFQRNTAEDLDNTLQELRARGMQGLVLDLRWNPGGLLDSAHQVSSLFLEEGEDVVSTKGRIQEEDVRLRANQEGPFSDVPLVVLVDDASASASEIVSGAIRDNHRGAVIGERTFGKFSVQNLIPLGASRAKLKITTARYYLPSGVSLHHDPGAETWGVEPDIPFPLCRKERIKVYEMRREANHLGPPAPTPSDEKAADKDAGEDKDGREGEDVKGGDSKKGPELADADKTTKEKPASETKSSQDAPDAGDKTTEVADADAKDELPPLEQSDTSERDKVDPQVRAAILYLRAELLGRQFSALATARPDPPRPSANP